MTTVYIYMTKIYIYMTKIYIYIYLEIDIYVYAEK